MSIGEAMNVVESTGPGGRSSHRYVVEYLIPCGPWLRELGHGYRTLWRARAAMKDHARRGLPARIVDTSFDAGGDE